jgi:hypothetical protein
MNLIRSIFNFFFEIFFGCRHDHLTRPFTLERETYKVCLDCGRQIFYSPETMRPLNSRELRRRQTAQLGVVKVIPANHATALAAGPKNDSNAAA